MSATLRTQAKPTRVTSPFPSVQAGILQRKCACGGSPGLADDCKECQDKRLTLQRYAADRAESYELLRSLAEPSNPAPDATVEPGFGHTFSRVQVHTHVPARIQPKLNVNEPGDQCEREADRVAEQVTMSVPPNREPTAPQFSASPSMIQRALAGEVAQAPELAPTEVVPETETTAGTPAAGLIAEDEASELGPEQMRKSEFLDELQTAVCAAADAELAAVGRSIEGCPYIEKWMGYYRTRDSQQVERTVRRYAPETVGVTTARDYIPLISERVRGAVAAWAKTGEITGVPEGVSTGTPGAGTDTSFEATPTATANVQSQGRGGRTRNADNPQTIQAQLGSGGALDTGLKSRMESAFGHDFSRVRVHTDSNAAELSKSLDARAFTIGSDIAFASGEYQPGTLIGDALIAHELAHVVQQKGGGAPAAHAPLGGEYHALEGDADRSAVSAVVSIWGGLKGALTGVAESAMPRLRAGLRLSQCKRTRNPCTERTAPATPVKSVTVRHSHLWGGKGSGAFSNELAYANKVYAIAGIRFAAGKEEDVGINETKALLGNTLLSNSEPKEPRAYTAEETALMAHSRASGEATVYYIEAFENRPALGITYPQNDGIVITNEADQRTLAHELGHLLIGGGGHDSVDDNIMAWSAVATGVDCLSDDQINAARGNSLAK